MEEVKLEIDPKYDKLEIIGWLYHSNDYGCRSEDMIEVYLPSNVGIWAGWYPDGMFDRPEGHYRIDLIQCDDSKYFIKCLRHKTTRNILEVKHIIEEWIKRYYESIY